MIWIPESDFRKFVAVLVGTGIAFGWLLFEGLPMLWAVVKPWLHAITG